MGQRRNFIGNSRSPIFGVSISVTTIKTSQYSPRSRNRLEEHLFQRKLTRYVAGSILPCLIPLHFLVSYYFVEASFQLFVDFALKDSAWAAIPAFTTPWRHTSNEPGSVRHKFRWGAEFMIITFGKG